MLTLFKSNNPAVVVLYVLYLALFRVFALYVHVDTTFVFAHSEPLSKIIFGLLKNVLQRHEMVSYALSGVLCFIQALLINNLINENKILPKKNYVGGLLFIIVFSFFKESLVLSPASLALTLIILSTQRIFSLIKKEKATGDIFDVGFLLSVATLIYFPCIVLVVFAFAGVAIVRPFAYREWAIVFVGLLSPFILLFTFYFWNDKTAMLFHDIANVHGKVWLKGPALLQTDWLLAGSLLVFILVSLVILPTALYSSLIQVRKFSTTLIVLIFLIGISFVLQQNKSLCHWALLALPLSVIFSMVLIQIKNKLVSEVIHLMLILLVLAGQYLPMLGIL